MFWLQKLCCGELSSQRWPGNPFVSLLFDLNQEVPSVCCAPCRWNLWPAIHVTMALFLKNREGLCLLHVWTLALLFRSFKVVCLLRLHGPLHECDEHLRKSVSEYVRSVHGGNPGQHLLSEAGRYASRSQTHRWGNAFRRRLVAASCGCCAKRWEVHSHFQRWPNLQKVLIRIFGLDSTMNTPKIHLKRQIFLTILW